MKHHMLFLRMRIILSVVSMLKWSLTKHDVNFAILQTGHDERDVYVHAPRESADRDRFIWLFPTAADGLENENCKRKVLSHRLIIDIGLELVPLFYQHC